MKAEKNDNNMPIEICDSDDDIIDIKHNDCVQSGTQATTDTNTSHANVNIGTVESLEHRMTFRNSVNTELSDVIKIKDEPNAEASVSGFADAPLVAFDANKPNDSVVAINRKSKSSKKIRQKIPSQNPNSSGSKRVGVVKRFKCKQCSYAFTYKSHFSRHQLVHANGKLWRIKPNQDGIYQCTHCILKYTDFGKLSRHMTRSHKDGQYLYRCARCMSKFSKRADKERHEGQCTGRVYQCHLCKVFITLKRNVMQDHARTHSGEKPFECKICKKNFRQGSSLKKHMNSTHS